MQMKLTSLSKDTFWIEIESFFARISDREFSEELFKRNLLFI